MKIVTIDNPAKMQGKLCRTIQSTPENAESDAKEWMDYRKTPGATVYRYDRGERGCLLYVEE